VRWEQRWECQSPPPLLRGLAWLYASGWRLYESLYRLKLKRRAQLPVLVVGVGSLRVGGAGKTPVAIAIARLLHQSGLRVAVLCSGYGGRRFNAISLLEPGTLPDPLEVGDEAVEVLQTLRAIPVAVGRRRVAVARAALEHWQSDVLVLDDGFQHLPLARTVDLVVLPAESPLGNGYCLPAGPLREPPAGIRRADAILLTRSHPASPLLALPHALSSLPTFEVVIEPEGLQDLVSGRILPTDALKGHEVIALAGIARANRFLQMLEQLGMQVSEARLFPDHYSFEREQWDWTRGRTLVMTAKDAVKLRPRLPADCHAFALRITARLESTFCNWLHQRLPCAV
jgi:tetraacyldisaccharide 4'-kinase